MQNNHASGYFALFFYYFERGVFMVDIHGLLENSAIIPAVHEGGFEEALKSPCDVIFHLGANILTVGKAIEDAHKNGKAILIHIDLAEGVGKDESGVKFLSKLNCDGIISTRAQIIKYAKKEGLFTVQRFFTLDSQGLDSIDDMLRVTSPNMIEIMPGVITKTVQRFAKNNVPVIAGGLIETKQELTNALSAGAVAVSTGKKELWYL